MLSIYVYLPTYQKRTKTDIDAIYKELKEQIHFVETKWPNSSIIVLGDFNSTTGKDLTKHGGDGKLNEAGICFLKMLAECNLQCINAKTSGLNETFVTPMGRRKILDYITCKRIQGFEAVTFECPELSDHNLLFSDFEFESVKFLPKKAKLYHKTNFHILGRRTRAGHKLRDQYRKGI